MSFAFNLTIDDTSPVLTYSPYGTCLSRPARAQLKISREGDGLGLNDGWSTWYSDLGFINSPGVEFGDIGRGTSYHITSLPGANVSLAFNGTSLTYTC